jgi:hypothetical protein
MVVPGFSVTVGRGFPVEDDVGMALTGRAFDVAVAEEVAGNPIPPANRDDSAALTSDEYPTAVTGISVKQLLDEAGLPWMVSGQNGKQGAILPPTQQSAKTCVLSF